MKQIDVKYHEIDIAEFKQRDALVTDVSRLIKEDCIISVEGKPVVFYKILDKDQLKHVRWAVKNTKYINNRRTGGLKTTSSVFGYMPRIALRSDYCHMTSMGESQQKQHKVITDFGKVLTDLYEEHMSEYFIKHEQVVKDKIKEDWIIEGTPFTSGIINKNNKLKYHFDSGNFKGVMSNMIVLKKDVDGGHLVIPELDIALEVPDGALVIFDGQQYLHGVSDIYYRNDHAYRYSIVYYSLEQMWQCETIDDEVLRVRDKKTQQQIKRIDPEHVKTLEEQLQKLKDKKNK